MKNVNVNYTEAQVAELVAAYEAVESEQERLAVVTEYAEKFEKTVASVRAKLVAEKVYVAKAKTAAKRLVRKDQLVTQLAELVDLDEEFLDSFSKVNRVALEKVVGRVRALTQNA